MPMGQVIRPMGLHIQYMWVFQLIILLLFFLIIWWVLRGNNNYGYKSDDSAIDILNKRLASGEITKKEYEEIKRDINTKDGD
ncbi:SHOCT domain-containing protein [Candidatus Woesearchaeota archaeon]|nr:SHOCT domain-containing protein [Candidatus Woesearchaeota archaeon]MBT6995338.1 SHOCT domain-containing protein [Candidatus Woesearchaeota archaeon]MBT7238039.1 SHOCT domain-containing protein [Candidatus Woesearchaeota archaeon]